MSIKRITNINLTKLQQEQEMLFNTPKDTNHLSDKQLNRVKEFDDESESEYAMSEGNQLITDGSGVNCSMAKVMPTGNYKEKNFYQVEVVPNEEFWNQFQLQKSRARSKSSIADVSDSQKRK